MNGQASKRIRIASRICGRPAKELKRAYKALPYHRRLMRSVVIEPHGRVLKKHHEVNRVTI